MKCWKCGNDFSGNFCPFCGEKAVSNSRRSAPQKRRRAKVWYKRWWVWCIAALVLASFFVPNGDKAAKTASADPSAAPSSSPSSEPVRAVIPSDDPTPEPIAAASDVENIPTVVPTIEETPEPVMAYIDARSLNMRAAASKDSDIVQEYEGGQAVEIIGEDGEWYKVAVSGVVGYMMKEYIALGAAPERTEAPVRESHIEPEPAPAAEPAPVAREIPHSENYHGHVYATPSGEKYHYEEKCGGKNSVEITWSDVDRRHLEPCGTCVLK